MHFFLIVLDAHVPVPDVRWPKHWAGQTSRAEELVDRTPAPLPSEDGPSLFPRETAPSARVTLLPSLPCSLPASLTCCWVTSQFLYQVSIGGPNQDTHNSGSEIIKISPDLLHLFFFPLEYSKINPDS